MEDPKKNQTQMENLQKENEQLKKSLKEKSDDSWPGPYKCNDCGMRVSYTFVLPFLRSQGLCPDCFNKES